MAYTFTQEELNQIQAAYNQANAAKADTEVGKFRDVYDLIYNIVTDSGFFYNSPEEGLEENVWTWIGGARAVNSGEGYFAHFIREYTRSQYEQRYRLTITDEDLNVASNTIARNFISDVLQGTTPTIEELGLIDAAPIAGDIFNQVYDKNFTPWAGTLLFPFLGIDSYFRDWLLTEDTIAEFKPLAGTYDLIASTASAIPLANSIVTVGANVLLTFGLGGSFAAFGTARELTGLTNKFVNQVYQIERYDFEIDLGNDLLFPGSKSAKYITGTLGDDSYNPDPANNLAVNGTAGVDVIHAGLGNDFIFGGDGNDLIDGGVGNDVIDTGKGDDLVRSGDGADKIILGEGENTILDGTAEDRIFLRGSLVGLDKVDDDDRLFPLLGGTASYITQADANGIPIVPANMFYDTDGDGNTEYWYASKKVSVETDSNGDDIIIGDDELEALGMGPFSILYEMNGADLEVSFFTSTSNIPPFTSFDPVGDQPPWAVNQFLQPTVAVILVDYQPGDFGITLSGPLQLALGIQDGEQTADENAIAAHNATIDAITNNGVINELLGPMIDNAPLTDPETGQPQLIRFRTGPGDDIVEGTEVDEHMKGEAGDDTLNGEGGDDLLEGGIGDDVLSGGEGENRLEGGPGDDSFLGGSGSDTFNGGSGTDTADYSASSSAISLNFAAGLFTGGDASNDTITGVEAAIGTAFNDSFTGSSADEIFFGGSGDDTLAGNDGNDRLDGGAGSDNLDGGQGLDIASYQNSLAGVMVDLINQLATGGDADGDSLINIEGAYGSAFTDTFVGDDFANTFFGGSGDDIIFGAAGDDTIEGGSGADTLDGGSGQDTLSYEASDAAVTVDLSSGQVSGGDGDGDSFTGFENLTGSAHGDSLTGDAAFNQIDGGEGDDFIHATAGGDFIFGGEGSDTLIFAASDAAVTVNLSSRDYSGGLASGVDALSIENIIGSDHADSLTGDDDTNILSGGGGDDILNGGGGPDIIDGGDGTGDIAVFDGNAADYRITRAEDGALRFDDLRTESIFGNSTITNVEQFQFNDGTIALENLNIENSAPTLTKDTAETMEEQPITITAASLLQNDQDFDGDSLTITGISNVKHGSAELQPNGDIIFTPAINFHGVARFDYQVSDGVNPPVSSRIHITVENTDDAPFARPDALPLYVGAATEITAEKLLGNDLEFDGDALQIVAVNALAGGTATLNGDGNVIFTPTGAVGDFVSVTYTVSDENGNQSTTAFTGTLAERQPLTAIDDQFAGTENTPITLPLATLLANDQNSAENPATIIKFFDVNNGRVSFNTAGDVVFTPAAGFSGDASFTYRASNQNGGEDTATVTITIEADATNAAPDANDDSGLQLDEDSSLTIPAATLLANDSDPDGDTLTITEVGAAQNGNVMLTPGGDVIFTPNADYNGPASFAYSISDGNGGTAIATASLTITPVNDAPTDLVISATDIEENSSAGTLIGELSVSDIDDGDSASFAITGGSGASLFEITDNELRLAQGSILDFEIDTSYSLEVEATDQGGLTTTQLLTINILDVLEGGATITGTSSRDILQGSESGETINGLGGHDDIFGNGGDDTLIGGSGADLLDGGSGNDTVDYATAGSGVTIFLTTALFRPYGIGLGSDATLDRLLNVENITGSQSADALVGNSEANRIDGGFGNDYLIGNGGSDTFIFREGYGTDTILDFDDSGSVFDSIAIDYAGINSFADLSPHVEAYGFFNSSTRIDFGNGDRLTLVGTRAQDLGSDHFDFF